MKYCPQCGRPIPAMQDACLNCDPLIASGISAVPMPESGKKSWVKKYLLPPAIFVSVILVPLVLIVWSQWYPESAYFDMHAAARTRYLTKAEMQYKSTYGRYTFDLKVLAGGYPPCPNNPNSAHACLIDSAAANSSSSNPLQGYYYKAAPGPRVDTIVVWGIPMSSGHRFFCATDDGMFRYSTRGAGISDTSYGACKTLEVLEPIDTPSTDSPKSAS